MLKSMTGFYALNFEIDGVYLELEIKALNSRSFDFVAKIPPIYSKVETKLKSLINETIKRGKVEVYLKRKVKVQEFNQKDEVNDLEKNEKIRTAVNSLRNLCNELKIDSNLFLVNYLPKIIEASNHDNNSKELSKTESLSEIEESFFIEQFKKGILAVDIFRRREGEAIEKTILEFLNIIKEETLLIKEKVSKSPGLKAEMLKTRTSKIVKFLEESMSLDKELKIDDAVFLQEIAILADKIDVSEELQRLGEHLDEFLRIIKETRSGKKLEFVAQEILRELNTTGSKCQDSEIQKSVVKMKFEIEKIKEQLGNIE